MKKAPDGFPFLSILIKLIHFHTTKFLSHLPESLEKVLELAPGINRSATCAHAGGGSSRLFAFSDGKTCP